MALEGDLDAVRGGGDGTDEQADLPDVAARVAVQREDLVDALQPATVDDLVRSAGDDLLRGLEDQPDAEAGGRERLGSGSRGRDRRTGRCSYAGRARRRGRRRRSSRPTEGRSARGPAGASRSARRATRYAGSAAPRSTTTPLPSSRVGARPAAVSRSATTRLDRVSRRASSGCAWRSRRRPTSSGSSSSTAACSTGSSGSMSVGKVTRPISTLRPWSAVPRSSSPRWWPRPWPTAAASWRWRARSSPTDCLEATTDGWPTRSRTRCAPVVRCPRRWRSSTVS